ncbi:tRNA (guanine(46)-N(7))-methyltransferase TrmB [Kordiimonas laminariae]|uniref:tRNA (guanine(46)-N(7))-methyltransferase TrmB n=1 Tax=Kordiimonas laminariae TaxID=2917717 RepID=UPI001FF148A7|nr:hypothetical protein [Kordiimonas laminariae]MCK0068710.1 hypothetical protein [Kordiimonas laminariae]
MQQKSRTIESNQTGPHERLEATVLKHLKADFKKPIADHTQRVFDEVNKLVSKHAGSVVFDSCCGVGDSTRLIARDHPDHLVIGIDKSASRVTRERLQVDPENMILRRADLNDFYRLMVTAGWQVEKHFVLYPNPWPKSAHLGRRWHGAPVFPYMLKLGGQFEMRSNWKLYLEEFQIALKLAGHISELEAFEPEEYLTPFEKKYYESGQQVYRLITDIKPS